MRGAKDGPLWSHIRPNPHSRGGMIGQHGAIILPPHASISCHSTFYREADKSIARARARNRLLPLQAHPALLERPYMNPHSRGTLGPLAYSPTAPRSPKLVENRPFRPISQSDRRRTWSKTTANLLPRSNSSKGNPNEVPLKRMQSSNQNEPTPANDGEPRVSPSTPTLSALAQHHCSIDRTDIAVCDTLIPLTLETMSRRAC